jgi:antitoxin MazE
MPPTSVARALARIGRAEVRSLGPGYGGGEVEVGLESEHHGERRVELDHLTRLASVGRESRRQALPRLPGLRDGVQRAALGLGMSVCFGSYVTSNEAPMIKKLSAVGNSLGLIIDRPILELLDITKDTALEIKTDGEALIIRPVKLSKKERIRDSTKRMIAVHDETLRKLTR